MEKKELIEQLTAAKTLTSTVDIDKVIGMIKQLETPTTISSELGSEIVDRIERCLDNNSRDFVDLDSAEFELSYDNRIELNRVDVNIYDIMEHITEIVDSYVALEEENDVVELERGDEQMQNINQGLGLEPGGNPYAEQ
jgi:hypothetical protein